MCVCVCVKWMKSKMNETESFWNVRNIFLKQNLYKWRSLQSFWTSESLQMKSKMKSYICNFIHKMKIQKYHWVCNNCFFKNNLDSSNWIHRPFFCWPLTPIILWLLKTLVHHKSSNASTCWNFFFLSFSISKWK